MSWGFLVLAVVDLLMLTATFGFGLAAGSDGGGRGIHELLGWGTTLVCGFTHGVACLEVLILDQRIRSRVRDRGLPEWVGLQRVKNWRRLRPFAAAGLVTLGLAAGMGLLNRWREGWGIAHAACGGLTLGFHLGTLVIEWASMTAQARLFGLVAGRF
jgi:hypothetical protein